MAVGRHGKKKSIPMPISFSDSGSSCDEFEIQVASPSNAAKRADERLGSSLTGDALAPKKSSYAERRTLLMQQRVKKLEEVSTLEFSASEWNDSAAGTLKKPPAVVPERHHVKLDTAWLEKPDAPDLSRRKPSATLQHKLEAADTECRSHSASSPSEKLAVVWQEEPVAALREKSPVALPEAPLQPAGADALPSETHPESTPRKSYAERRRLLRCAPRAQNAMEQDARDNEPLFTAVQSDALPARSKSAVAPVRECKTPPPRLRAQTNPSRHPRSKTPPPETSSHCHATEATPARTRLVEGADALRDELERPRDVERPRARTNPGPGKSTTLSPDVGVVSRSRSAVSARSKRSSVSGTPPTKKPPTELLPFFLASCPSEVLADAIIIMKKYGGFYAAGDADDVFNKDVLVSAGAGVEQAESWKAGWKGKVEMCFNMMKQMRPGKQIIAIAVAGGPACDWERQQIFTRFCKVHEDLLLKQVGDVEDLEAWLQRTGYKPKAVSYGTRKAVGKATNAGKRIRTPPKCGTI